MVIAQISDTHIREEGQLAYRHVETAGFLARCVQQLRSMSPRPDFVLATGDLVDAGRREEYRHLRRLLAPLPMPVYLVPGNHDDRDAMVAEFPDHAYLRRDGTFLQYVIEGDPMRLVVLDTLVPGRGEGRLCADRLAWLDARLRERPDRPTTIVMHHPPFVTGIEHMDRLGLLEGGEGLGEIVERYANVERIVCGHLHRPIQVRWHGTVAMTAPSTAHQVALDLAAGDPACYVMEPPACLLHVWRDGVGLISHTVYIGEFPRYRFREPAG